MITVAGFEDELQESTQGIDINNATLIKSIRSIYTQYVLGEDRKGVCIDSGTLWRFTGVDSVIPTAEPPVGSSWMPLDYSGHTSYFMDTDYIDDGIDNTTKGIFSIKTPEKEQEPQEKETSVQVNIVEETVGCNLPLGDKKESNKETGIVSFFKKFKDREIKEDKAHKTSYVELLNDWCKSNSIHIEMIPKLYKAGFKVEANNEGKDLFILSIAAIPFSKRYREYFVGEKTTANTTDEIEQLKEARLEQYRNIEAEIYYNRFKKLTNEEREALKEILAGFKFTYNYDSFKVSKAYNIDRDTTDVHLVYAFHSIVSNLHKNRIEINIKDAINNIPDINVKNNSKGIMIEIAGTLMGVLHTAYTMDKLIDSLGNTIDKEVMEIKKFNTIEQNNRTGVVNYG